jgi:hypothetical protein
MEAVGSTIVKDAAVNGARVADVAAKLVSIRAASVSGFDNSVNQTIQGDCSL